MRQDSKGSNCYIKDGCAGSKHGCCDDGFTMKYNKYGTNCDNQQYEDLTPTTTTSEPITTESIIENDTGTKKLIIYDYKIF